MTKLLFFAGSSRKGSANSRLVKAAEALTKNAFGNDVVTTRIHLSDFDMPTYDSDADGRGDLPENAHALRDILVANDGIFLGSDEYTGAYSALLRNSFSWLTRVEDQQNLIFKGKIVALCGAAPGGVGGLRGHPALHQLLSTMGATVIGQQISLGTSSSPFDMEGHLLPRVEKQMLDEVIPKLFQAARNSRK